MRGRLDFVMMGAAVAFQTLLNVFQTTRRHIPGALNVMLYTFVWFKGTLIEIGVVERNCAC